MIAAAALGAVLLWTDPNPAGAATYKVESFDRCSGAWSPYGTSLPVFCPRSRWTGAAFCQMAVDQDHFFRVSRCPIASPSCEQPALPDGGSRVSCLVGPCREHSPFYVEPE